MLNMKTNLKFRLRKIVNASGRMTKLGVSTQSKYVQDNMLYGSNNYFDIDELYVQAGSYIAKMLEAEDAVVTSCASSGIVFTIAGLICGSNHRLVENLHIEKDNISKREVILPKGHSVNYGAPVHTMIELGGGKVVEVGNANKVTRLDVESYISDKTLALFYVKSHHSVQKNMASIEEMHNLSQKYNIPLIIDAAAEEDLKTYYKQGADFVVYSGSKALCGPSSGFVLCRSKEQANNLRKQYYGVGRSMKIGKENIFGLVAAIEEYYQEKESIINNEDLQVLVDKFNKVEGLSATIAQDEAGREIYRCKLHVDEKVFGISGYDLNEKLKSGNPGIYCREHEVNLGNLSFDPRPLTSKEDLDLIYETVLKIGGKDEN
jgi:uncharacterized pyridoxal phosphate-dependent enzyme